jgi:hypothetical protein
MIASLRAGASFHCHKGVSIEPRSEHGFAYPNDEAGKPAKPRAPIVIPSAVLRAGARRHGFAGVAAGSASITGREIKSTQTTLLAVSAVSLLTRSRWIASVSSSDAAPLLHPPLYAIRSCRIALLGAARFTAIETNTIAHVANRPENRVAGSSITRAKI